MPVDELDAQSRVPRRNSDPLRDASRVCIRWGLTLSTVICCSRSPKLCLWTCTAQYWHERKHEPHTNENKRHALSAVIAAGNRKIFILGHLHFQGICLNMTRHFQ